MAGFEKFLVVLVEVAIYEARHIDARRLAITPVTHDRPFIWLAVAGYEGVEIPDVVGAIASYIHVIIHHLILKHLLLIHINIIDAESLLHLRC